MGSRTVLVADRSGDEPFDEACSMVWPRLAEELTRRLGHPVTLPHACVAVTVELRGEHDVEHALAAADAEALLQYLAWRGLIDGAPERLPDLACAPTPLAGSIPVVAPHGGVLVFLRELGERMVRGQPIAEIVNPADGTATVLASPTDGVFYARESRRFVPAGTRIAKVAGREAVRSGNLLSD
jgi:predicted deacylase